MLTGMKEIKEVSYYLSAKQNKNETFPCEVNINYLYLPMKQVFESGILAIILYFPLLL